MRGRMLSAMTDEPPPIETDEPPREFNPNASCRLSSAESDMRGRCLRCGSGVGELCGDVAMTER
jgi:hypothetical protein